MECCRWAGMVSSYASSGRRPSSRSSRQRTIALGGSGITSPSIPMLMRPWSWHGSRRIALARCRRMGRGVPARGRPQTMGRARCGSATPPSRIVRHQSKAISRMVLIEELLKERLVGHGCKHAAGIERNVRSSPSSKCQSIYLFPSIALFDRGSCAKSDALTGMDKEMLYIEPNK